MESIRSTPKVTSRLDYFTLLFESTHLALEDDEGLDTCKRCYETQKKGVYAKFDSGVASFPGNGPGNETRDRVVTAM